MIKKIITSSKTTTFNALVEATSRRLIGISQLAKNSQARNYIVATRYQLGFVCGIYKSAYDTSPGSIKYDEKELNDTIKKIITTQVSRHKYTKLADTYFGGLFSEVEAYKKAAIDEYAFNDFSSRVFGDASILVQGFSQGYIAGIKSLCDDYSIPFEEPHSEINCVLKNWKFFFLPPDDKIEFRIDGTFFWGPQAMIEVEINKEVYAKLKKHPLNEFHNRITVVELSEFL